MTNSKSASRRSPKRKTLFTTHLTAPISPEQRLKDVQVAELLNIGRSTVWKLVAEGRLVAPERYGSRCTRWRYGSLIDYLEEMSEGEKNHV